MKRKIIFTLLWMLGFAAVTALLGLATVAILVRTAREISIVMYTHNVLFVLFVVSPFIALLLGLRGALPGTKQRSTTDAG